MHFPRISLFPLVALGAVACAPKPSYLFVDPAGGRPRVELRHTFGVISRVEEPVPLDDCAFYRLAPEAGALSAPEEIWRVMSLSPDHATLGVLYGVVPPEFVQVTPQGAPAPALEGGVRYRVECTGDGIGVTEFTFEREPITPP